MNQQQTSISGQKRWRRGADAILLLSVRKILIVLLIWALDWLISRLLIDQAGLLPEVVFQLGAAAIPLYLIVALAFTIVRTQPRGRYLRLNRYMLLLLPAFLLSAVLHNILYALYYPYFQREVGDEGPFFLLAVLVLPLYLLVVLLYTALTFIRGGRGPAGDGRPRHGI